MRGGEQQRPQPGAGQRRGESGAPLDPADEASLLTDRAPAKSWSATIGSLDAAAVLEVQLVNALSPVLLCDRLLPLLLASPH
ncbi:hypothetical protein VM98_35535, partial [Streptomyces rubellomurinus subsp. indigoferus]